MKIIHTLGGLATATAVAFLFAYLQVPLAYILGAMAGSALYGNLFSPLGFGRYIRRFGLLVIGTGVATLLTPAVVSDLVKLFPLMLGAAIVANLVAVVLAWPVGKIAGIDRVSSILACLPAGMAEMATLARDLNAQEHAVTLIHTLRVILVVTLMPILLGVSGARRPAPHVDLSALDAALLVGVFIGGFLLARVAARVGLLNPWVIAPMALGIAAVGMGGSLPRLPQWVVVVAQLAIGASLGARFRIRQMRELPRAAVGGVFVALVLIAILPVGLAELVNVFSEFDFTTLSLSLAPGGLGEMIASAKALGLASATVAGFQFVRAVVTNLVVPILIKRWVTIPSGADDD